MEQIGENNKKFIDFLISKQFEIVINIEPEDHFYIDNEFDKRAKIYHQKRGYLTKFYDYLIELEKRNIIDIIYINKLFFGSLMHDPYVLFAWKPKFR